jgi:hypothetical protein
MPRPQQNEAAVKCGADSYTSESARAKKNGKSRRRINEAVTAFLEKRKLVFKDI